MSCRSRRSLARFCPLFCGLALLVGSAAFPTDEAPAEPLGDEQIVKLHMAGTKRLELIRLIRDSAVEFDVSPEMLTELRLAGIHESVIDAMIARQREMDRERAAGKHFEGPGERLIVLLNPDARNAKQRRITIKDEVGPRLAADWRLAPSEEQRRFRDLAIFLVCRTHDHVPDQWRAHSPLGQDPQPIERHRILAFAPGATWSKGSFFSRFGFAPTLGTVNTENRQRAAAGANVVPAGRAPGSLELQLPESFEVEMQPGVEHDLSIGIALQVGYRYYHWQASSIDGVVLADGPLTLSANVKGGSRLKSLEIDFDEPTARKSGGRSDLGR